MNKKYPFGRFKDYHGRLTYEGKKALVEMREHGGLLVEDVCDRLEISTKTYYRWWNRYKNQGYNGLQGPRYKPIKPAHSEISRKKKDYIVHQRRKKKSFGWIAKQLRIAKSTAYRWWRRFVEEGKAGLERRSRRPSKIHRTHPAIEEKVLDINEDFGFGPHKIEKGLWKWEGEKLGHTTIYRILRSEGRVKATKRRGKQRDYVRWERHHPDSLWQIDLHAVKSGPNKGEVLVAIIDDCSRKVIAAHIQEDYSVAPILECLRELFVERRPRQILTDNGSQFVSVLNQEENDRTQFQKLLLAHGVEHIRARVRHPQTTGKIERFFRTFEEEHERFRCLDEYLYFYNHTRFHQSLGQRVPAECYEFNYCAEALLCC